MFIFKLRVVGGPLWWEALGHGLLGLGLKRALEQGFIKGLIIKPVKLEILEKNTCLLSLFLVPYNHCHQHLVYGERKLVSSLTHSNYLREGFKKKKQTCTYEKKMRQKHLKGDKFSYIREGYI